MQCKSAKAAEQTARRIMDTVRATPVHVSGGEAVTLTVTLGLAEVGGEEELSSAIKRADAALYAASRAGVRSLRAERALHGLSAAPASSCC